MSYINLYHKSLEEPVAFWAEQAQALDWFKFPPTILGEDADGLYRWFAGGELNTCHLALDTHVEHGRGEQVALIYDSPGTGVVQKFTFRELRDLVARHAGMLQKLGVKKGDRVIIYMPMIPQAVMAMLACARIGAVHSVVFGGFSAHELALRIDDAQPRVLLMASGGMEFDKVIPYKPIVDQALEKATYQPEAVVVWQREFVQSKLQRGRDKNWSALLSRCGAVDCVPVEATDPLYILYTSGTTGKPKGIVRDNGGHAVALNFSMKHIYGVEAGDVFWAGSDIGWVVGHSYIVYGPLMRGCTTVLYEGKPVRTPDAGAYWRVISEHGVNVFFTAPTGIRAVKKEDPEGKLSEKYDLTNLRRVFLAGERCDVATLQWLHDLIHLPVIDHWWQTESGWPMLANPAGVELMTIKPGSAGIPMCGFDIQILDSENQVLPTGTEGAVGIKLPLPPGCLPNLWQNTDRFKSSYMSQYPGYYFSGDGGYKDEDGYVYITGRIDDIINVAGHRLSTAEMEEAVASHPAVAECAVIGIEDNLKGQIPVGFVVLKGGYDMRPDIIEKELVSLVREHVGPVAAFKRAVVAKRLPKTRSGKILRKIMRNMADKVPFTTPSTIEDVMVLDELTELMRIEKIGNLGL